MATTADLAPALFLTTSISGVATDAGGPYDEQSLNYMLEALHGAGQSGIVSPGDLTVLPLSPTAGAQVLVTPGGAWIAGSSSPTIQGTYLIRSIAQVTLDVPAASTSVARNDIVVARVLDKTYDGQPVSGVQYRARLEYIQGDQSTGAAPPIPANCAVLAKILTPAGSSTVVNSAAITNQNQYGATVQTIWPWIGPPTSGTYVVGASGYDQLGSQWVCYQAGTPGKWNLVGGRALISTTALTANTSKLFSNIPQCYNHLHFDIVGHGPSGTFVFNDISIQFNNDAGNNYGYGNLQATGVTVAGNGVAGNSVSGQQAQSLIARLTDNASNWSGAEIDVKFYSTTGQNKTAFGKGYNIEGWNNTNNGVVERTAWWFGTGPINTVNLKFAAATTGTVLLYGVM